MAETRHHIGVWPPLNSTACSLPAAPAHCEPPVRSSATPT